MKDISVNTILSSKYVVVSVIGDPGEERLADIYRRKTEDISKLGVTYWVYRSSKSQPSVVQHLSKMAADESQPCYCILIEPSIENGVKRRVERSEAKYFWAFEGGPRQVLRAGLSPVTGKLSGRGACALVFDQLVEIDSERTLNLWDYSEFGTSNSPIGLGQGASTICALKQDTSTHPNKMKSNLRKISAIARLKDPFCGFVR